MSLSVLWSWDSMQKSCLFSTRTQSTERQRLDTTKPALGVSMQQPGRVLTMTPRRCLPVSATVQDQRLGRSLVFDTIFSILCSTVTEDVWKHALVWFWKALCVLKLPHKWLCVERRLPLPQTAGKWQKWSLCSQLENEAIPSPVSNTCVSVIWTNRITGLLILFR